MDSQLFLSHNYQLVNLVKSRKTSRIDNLTEIFNRLLIPSDPVIKSLRILPNLYNKIIRPKCIRNAYIRTKNIPIIETFQGVVVMESDSK